MEFPLAIPASALYPLRYAAANLARRNPLRKASVEIIRLLCGQRPRVPSALPEIRPLDMPHLSFLPTDSMVMEAVYWLGVRGYEGVMSDVWMKLCDDASNVLEIGANVGLFSVIGANRRPNRYTAVEPLPEVAAVLRANLERNNLGFVDVVEGAVIPGSSKSMVEISIPNERHGAPVGAHLIEQVEVSNRSALRTIIVSGHPISSLIEGRDLVKIDAEGIEAQLLSSAAQEIIRTKPTLVIEVLPEAKQLGQVLKELASSAGYKIYVVPGYGSDSVVPISAAEFSSTIPLQYNSKDVVLSARAKL